MIRERAIAHAHAAAEAAFRSAGGPPGLSWVQCLNHSEAEGPEILYLFVVQNALAPVEALYEAALASDASAKPFAQAHEAVRLACIAFRAIVLVLEPMVQLAEAAELARLKHRNVVDLSRRRATHDAGNKLQ